MRGSPFLISDGLISVKKIILIVLIDTRKDKKTLRGTETDAQQSTF